MMWLGVGGLCLGMEGLRLRVGEVFGACEGLCGPVLGLCGKGSSQWETVYDWVGCSYVSSYANITYDCMHMIICVHSYVSTHIPTSYTNKHLVCTHMIISMQSYVSKKWQSYVCHICDHVHVVICEQSYTNKNDHMWAIIYDYSYVSNHM